MSLMSFSSLATLSSGMPKLMNWFLRSANRFSERRNQFINWGIPEDKVAKLEKDIKDMWGEGPGGWVYEWSQVAKRFADKGDHIKAATAYGAAKFPTISTQAKQDALVKQVEHYILASPSFKTKFDRRLVPCYHKGRDVPVPVH